MNRLSGIIRGCNELAATLWVHDPESAEYVMKRAGQYAAIVAANGRKEPKMFKPQYEVL